MGIQAFQDLTQLHGCTTISYQLLGPAILQPGWQNNKFIQKYQNAAVNGGKAIGRPFLVIQGEADPIIYPPTVETAINDTAQIFPNNQIGFHLWPHVTHILCIRACLFTLDGSMQGLKGKLPNSDTIAR